ncbi:MAG: hypothetical protein HFH68_01545 [Lachnospiraceae bacterium]|nr:hypothetical protein [Lachnospiraceae bacterium]
MPHFYVIMSVSYLNVRLEEKRIPVLKRLEVNLEFEYWCEDQLCTRVFADYAEQSVKVENFTDDIIFQAFERRKITIGTVAGFLWERVFQKNKGEL